MPVSRPHKTSKGYNPSNGVVSREKSDSGTINPCHRGARARFLSPPPPTGPGLTTFFISAFGATLQFDGPRKSVAAVLMVSQNNQTVAFFETGTRSLESKFGRRYLVTVDRKPSVSAGADLRQVVRGATAGLIEAHQEALDALAKRQRFPLEIDPSQVPSMLADDTKLTQTEVASRAWAEARWDLVGKYFSGEDRIAESPERIDRWLEAQSS